MKRTCLVLSPQSVGIHLEVMSDEPSQKDDFAHIINSHDNWGT